MRKKKYYGLILLIIAVGIAGYFINKYTPANFAVEEASEEEMLVYNDISQYYTDGRLNINTADERLLVLLEGVGESMAKLIIQYREENGQFNTIEDLKNVKGMGDKKFDKIKDYICVE